MDKPDQAPAGSIGMGLLEEEQRVLVVPLASVSHPGLVARSGMGAEGAALAPILPSFPRQMPLQAQKQLGSDQRVLWQALVKLPLLQAQVGRGVTREGREGPR